MEYNRGELICEGQVMAMANVTTLLDELRSSFPKKKEAFELIMRQAGIEDTITQVVQPPIPVDLIPTFAADRFYPLSPMLKARFDCAGAWKEGDETWLHPAEMSAVMQEESVRGYHESLREQRR